MLFRGCSSYAANTCITSLLFEPQEHTKKFRPLSNFRNLGLKKSGCLEVLICLYESVSLYAASFDTTPGFLVKIHVQHIIFICVIFVCNIMSNGFSSWKIMKYHEMPPLCLSPIRFSIFSSKRPFDLASTPAPASRSICITLVLPFHEACHSGVRPRRNKWFVTLLRLNHLSQQKLHKLRSFEDFFKLFSSTGSEKIFEMFPCNLCSLPEFMIQPRPNSRPSLSFASVQPQPQGVLVQNNKLDAICTVGLKWKCSSTFGPTHRVPNVLGWHSRFNSTIFLYEFYESYHKQITYRATHQMSSCTRRTSYFFK